MTKEEIFKNIAAQLDGKDIKEKVYVYGDLVDVYKLKSDLLGIECLLQTFPKIFKEIDKKTALWTLFKYFTGVALGDFEELVIKTTQKPVIYKNMSREENLERQLFTYRDALQSEGFSDLDSSFQACIYTNLANVYSHTGRTLEAIDLWNKAIKASDQFPMATANLAYGIQKLGEITSDPGHKMLLYKNAYDKYKKLNFSLYPEDSKKVFKREAKKLEFLRDIPDEKFNFKGFPPIRKQDSRYREWVLEKDLFLNPASIVIKNKNVMYDPLKLPSLLLDINTGSRYHGLFNQIKQEFCSMRFVAYEGITGFGKRHFSDSNVVLFDQYDYPSYSIHIEKIKLAYRSAYSILDKINYFLINFFEVDVKNFKDSGLLDVTYKLISDKGNAHNWAIQSLYWLSKDLYKENYSELVDEDMKLIRTIRNKLEHEYLKVSDEFHSPNPRTDGVGDDLGYLVHKNDFINKAVMTMKIAKNGIFYLMYILFLEEFSKRKKLGENEITPTIFIDEYPDDFKR